MGKDIARYFLLVFLIGLTEILAVTIGFDHNRASYDKICLSAALITIIWAIRDGQET